MNDDWYWKAIYSNVPTGPSRSRPVAQRNPSSEVHIAKNGTPYVYENGRPKFISKAAAARMNPAEAHGAFARNNPKKVYDLYVYEGEETRFAGTFGSAKAALKVAPKGNSEIRIRYEKEGRWDADTYAYVTKQGTLDLTGNVRRNPAKAKKNNHRVWDQVIDPFSVTEARTYGRQPIARRNKAKRNPAGAHGAFDQVIGPFSVEEISFDGEQPYARRNARKSKAKRNGVVRVYEVK